MLNMDFKSTDIEIDGPVVEGWTMESGVSRGPGAVKIHLPSVTPESAIQSSPRLEEQMEIDIVGPAFQSFVLEIL
jgi:hypothetical protein